MASLTEKFSIKGQTPISHISTKPFSLSHPEYRKGAGGGGSFNFSLFTFHPLVANIFFGVDQRGNVFETQIPSTGGAGSTMSLKLLFRCGNPVASLAFLNRITMVIGLVDGSFRLYQAQSGSMLCKIRGHRAPVHQVIPQPCKEVYSSNVFPNLLTVSSTEVILWDMKDKKKLRVLVGASAIGIDQAAFDQKGSFVLTLFQDDTLAVWDVTTFQCIYKISLKKLGISPEVINPMTSVMEEPSIDLDPSGPFVHRRNPCMKERMAFSKDNRFLVLASSSKPVLAVWNWNDRNLHNEIKIPSFSASSCTDYPIKEIAFIGNTKSVAILSSLGQLIIVDVDAGVLLYKMRIKMDAFRISLTGSYLASQVTNLGHAIKFIPISLILEQQNRIENPSFLHHMNEREQVDRFIYHNDVFDSEDRKVVENAFGKSINEKLFPRPEEMKKKIKRKPLVDRVKGDDAGHESQKTCTSLMDLVRENETISKLNRKKLASYLGHFGEYPDKYRLLIWRFLLRLPENRHAYQTLSDKGMHPSFQQLNMQYPIKSYKTLRSMERILSALGYWSPILAESDYIPSLVFPFVTIFHNSWDTFTCFEIVVTMVLNWCQHWFEYYPNPPLHVLNLVEDIMTFHEPKLLDHFKTYKITGQYYAWPLIQTLFASHFSKPEWCIVMDHVISNEPSFIYYLVVAYLRYHRDNLMRIYDARDYEVFFNRVNATNIHRWIRLAHAIEEKTPSRLKPSRDLIKPFTAIPQKIHERIRKEELEFIRRRKILDDLDDLEQDLRVDESKWVGQQENMTQALDQWWNDLVHEEESHEKDKSKLLALETEKRAKVIEAIRDARTRFLAHQKAHTTIRKDLHSRLKDSRFQKETEDKALERMTEKADNLEPMWHDRYNQMLQSK